MFALGPPPRSPPPPVPPSENPEVQEPVQTKNETDSISQPEGSPKKDLIEEENSVQVDTTANVCPQQTDKTLKVAMNEDLLLTNISHSHDVDNAVLITNADSVSPPLNLKLKDLRANANIGEFSPSNDTEQKSDSKVSESEVPNQPSLATDLILKGVEKMESEVPGKIDEIEMKTCSLEVKVDSEELAQMPDVDAQRATHNCDISSTPSSDKCNPEEENIEMETTTETPRVSEANPPIALEIDNQSPICSSSPKGIDIDTTLSTVGFSKIESALEAVLSAVKDLSCSENPKNLLHDDNLVRSSTEKCDSNLFELDEPKDQNLNDEIVPENINVAELKTFSLEEKVDLGKLVSSPGVDANSFIHHFDISSTSNSDKLKEEESCFNDERNIKIIEPPPRMAKTNASNVERTSPSASDSPAQDIPPEQPTSSGCEKEAEEPRRPPRKSSSQFVPSSSSNIGQNFSSDVVEDGKLFSGAFKGNGEKSSEKNAMVPHNRQVQLEQGSIKRMEEVCTINGIVHRKRRSVKEDSDEEDEHQNQNEHEVDKSRRKKLH